MVFCDFLSDQRLCKLIPVRAVEWRRFLKIALLATILPLGIPWGALERLAHDIGETFSSQ